MMFGEIPIGGCPCLENGIETGGAWFDIGDFVAELLHGHEQLFGLFRCILGAASGPHLQDHVETIGIGTNGVLPLSVQAGHPLQQLLSTPRGLFGVLLRGGSPGHEDRLETDERRLEFFVPLHLDENLLTSLSNGNGGSGRGGGWGSNRTSGPTFQEEMIFLPCHGGFLVASMSFFDDTFDETFHLLGTFHGIDFFGMGPCVHELWSRLQQFMREKSGLCGTDVFRHLFQPDQRTLFLILGVAIGWDVVWHAMNHICVATKK
mmetsp:Transcript_12786/g.29771  ORF Transcript_12786/g.29771 Transcript_12786/m.29771 type:complete len:262 (-) Transcript_12786:156-941(-)